MKRQYVAVTILVLAALVVAFLAVSLSGLTPFNSSFPTPTGTKTPSQPTSSPTSTPIPSQTPTPSMSNGPTTYTYKIVKTYPHNTTAFTEGLVFDNGVLYESTGTFGSSTSSLRRINFETGQVQQEIFLPSQYFGEGLTLVDNSLVQLTWQNNMGFIYDKETFGLLKNFSYSTEGWGLTYNGNNLIMSDGSANLYFLDPVTLQNVGQVNVHDGNTSVTNINELEYVNGDVYANIWLQQKIAIINPQNGIVKGWMDLTGIYQSNNVEEVLNGIAYDSQSNTFFVTGKNWPNLYQISIAPKPYPP